MAAGCDDDYPGTRLGTLGADYRHLPKHLEGLMEHEPGFFRGVLFALAFSIPL
jgi:hypothetical protein